MKFISWILILSISQITSLGSGAAHAGDSFDSKLKTYLDSTERSNKTGERQAEIDRLTSRTLVVEAIFEDAEAGRLDEYVSKLEKLDSASKTHPDAVYDLARLLQTRWNRIYQKRYSNLPSYARVSGAKKNSDEKKRDAYSHVAAGAAFVAMTALLWKKPSNAPKVFSAMRSLGAELLPTALAIGTYQGIQAYDRHPEWGGGKPLPPSPAQILLMGEPREDQKIWEDSSMKELLTMTGGLLTASIGMRIAVFAVRTGKWANRASPGNKVGLALITFVLGELLAQGAEYVLDVMNYESNLSRAEERIRNARDKIHQGKASNDLLAIYQGSDELTYSVSEYGILVDYPIWKELDSFLAAVGDTELTDSAMKNRVTHLRNRISEIQKDLGRHHYKDSKGLWVSYGTETAQLEALEFTLNEVRSGNTGRLAESVSAHLSAFQQSYIRPLIGATKGITIPGLPQRSTDPESIESTLSHEYEILKKKLVEDFLANGPRRHGRYTSVRAAIYLESLGLKQIQFHADEILNRSTDRILLVDKISEAALSGRVGSGTPLESFLTVLQEKMQALRLAQSNPSGNHWREADAHRNELTRLYGKLGPVEANLMLGVLTSHILSSDESRGSIEGLLVKIHSAYPDLPYLSDPNEMRALTHEMEKKQLEERIRKRGIVHSVVMDWVLSDPIQIDENLEVPLYGLREYPEFEVATRSRLRYQNWDQPTLNGGIILPRRGVMEPAPDEEALVRDFEELLNQEANEKVRQLYSWLTVHYLNPVELLGRATQIRVGKDLDSVSLLQREVKDHLGVSEKNPLESELLRTRANALVDRISKDWFGLMARFYSSQLIGDTGKAVASELSRLDRLIRDLQTDIASIPMSTKERIRIFE